ncbi:flagellar basal-body rod protein FlgB [Fontimonas thermophila]|uniref:Flagellar basal body rod protein FlgB n=1 Tax=Fontimonas thermophila TaxID=1076937 RepID=A0A1I2JND0_9GAMM|nr:flagellar basal body rod protein FlgB [Fontimonas thermophila]SFF55413.1 flagellar basal-body rod protein FlgB [Fontimonas thermophila]
MAVKDPLFGIHPAALQLQRRRMELIAANIANADTPGYRARDVDFRAVLSSTQARAAVLRTHDAHLGAASADIGGEAVGYRVPVQPSADGNTVDVQIEQAQFADAALRYQASLQFLDARIKSLLGALSGQ